MSDIEQQVIDVLIPILPRMPDNAVHAAHMAVEFAQDVSKGLEDAMKENHRLREQLQKLTMSN